MAFYDKHHLFFFFFEHLHYTAGQERSVEEWRGVRFLLQVCYDLRFPVWSRSREDYDAIIYVANWPTSRQEAWRTLLKARAIENQCYVLGVNRVGTDPICQYSGGTAFVDPYGRAEECSDKQQEHDQQDRIRGQSERIKHDPGGVRPEKSDPVMVNRRTADPAFQQGQIRSVVR